MPSYLEIKGIFYVIAYSSIQRLKSPSKITKVFFSYNAGLKSGLHNDTFVILATEFYSVNRTNMLNN